jgi:hypothetical protein
LFKLHSLVASLVQIACTGGHPGSDCMHWRPAWFKLRALVASLVQIACTGGQHGSYYIHCGQNGSNCMHWRAAWLKLHALAASLVQIACTGGQTAEKWCIRLIAMQSHSILHATACQVWYFMAKIPYIPSACLNSTLLHARKYKIM